MKAQQLPEVECERKDWWKLVESARNHLQLPDFPAYRCLLEYGVCRRSLITLDSAEMFKLWRITGGLNVKSPGEYYALTSLWTETVQLIESEMAKVTNGAE